MNADDREDFLSRWSRLKKAVRAEEKPAEPKPGETPSARPAPASTASPAPLEPIPPKELPPLESLKGLASEYTEFLRPGVDENLKRAALKKLFRDPHFEAFERFEAYCEDYTQGEPIPAAMLRTLEHAKGLLFDEEKKETPKETPLVANGPAPEPLPEPAGKIEPQIQAEAPLASADDKRDKV